MSRYIITCINPTELTVFEHNAVVTPLRKAASYEQLKTNLGSSP